LNSIIDNCSYKEEFIKRKVDDLMNSLNSKAVENTNKNKTYNDSGWKVVDKGGKYKKGNFLFFIFSLNYFH